MKPDLSILYSSYDFICQHHAYEVRMKRVRACGGACGGGCEVRRPEPRPEPERGRAREAEPESRAREPESQRAKAREPRCQRATAREPPQPESHSQEDQSQRARGQSRSRGEPRGGAVPRPSTCERNNHTHVVSERSARLCMRAQLRLNYGRGKRTLKARFSATSSFASKSTRPALPRVTCQ